MHDHTYVRRTYVRTYTSKSFPFYPPSLACGVCLSLLKYMQFLVRGNNSNACLVPRYLLFDRNYTYNIHVVVHTSTYDISGESIWGPYSKPFQYGGKATSSCLPACLPA